MFDEEGRVSTQCDKFNITLIVDALHYKQPERCEQQEDKQNVVQKSDEVSETDWREEQMLPNEYSAYCKTDYYYAQTVREHVGRPPRLDQGSEAPNWSLEYG